LKFRGGLTWSMGFVFSTVREGLRSAFKKPEDEGLVEQMTEFWPNEL
jgi:hypothetical protein